MSAVARELMTSAPVVVFSKTYCPFCDKLKSLFNSLHVPFTAIELDIRNDGDAIQAALAKETGLRTVPNVVIGGVSVGGCDDTHNLHRKGDLKSILSKQGIAIE
jgi:glutaredoxin 3